MTAPQSPAYPQLRAQLRQAAIKAVTRYLDEHRAELPRTLYSEQQVQVHVAPGITVDGRIDLIKRLDTNETSIVDFKSSERAQADDITRDQLHVYVVGYEELTGQRADLVEVPRQRSSRPCSRGSRRETGAKLCSNTSQPGQLRPGAPGQCLLAAADTRRCPRRPPARWPAR